MRMHFESTVVRGLAGVLFAFGGSAWAAVVTAVEFHDDARERYFVTTFPAEETVLDAGVAWARTATVFRVHDAPVPGLLPVCRFFRRSAATSTHFYSASPAECDALAADPAWTFEAIAFHVTPVGDDATCPFGTAPVYRVYDPGRSQLPAHRWTPRRSERDTMLASGWIAEGWGEGIVFCVPFTPPDEALRRLQQLELSPWTFLWSIPSASIVVTVHFGSVQNTYDPQRPYEVRSQDGFATAYWDPWRDRVVVELQTFGRTLLVFPFDGNDVVEGCAFAEKDDGRVVIPPPPFEQLDYEPCGALIGERG